VSQQLSKAAMSQRAGIVSGTSNELGANKEQGVSKDLRESAMSQGVSMVSRRQ